MALLDWRRTEIRGARVAGSGEGFRLERTGSGAPGYANAQIDDYRDLPRRDFPHRPPLRLSLSARFSHPAFRAGLAPGSYLEGTAGFGFWNDPMMPGRWPPVAPPSAVWFFYASPPTDAPWLLGTPGPGWKASTVYAPASRLLSMVPLLPLVPFAGTRAGRRGIWPRLQRRFGCHGVNLDASLTEWHRYEIGWEREGCSFTVDGTVVACSPHSPPGPLGLVIWLDNQYLVLSRGGRFRWGTLSSHGDQWLEVKEIEVEGLETVRSLG